MKGIMKYDNSKKMLESIESDLRLVRLPYAGYTKRDELSMLWCAVESLTMILKELLKKNESEEGEMG